MRKGVNYTDFYTLSKCVTKCVILSYFVNNVKNSIFKTTSNISFSKTPSDFYYYKYLLHLPVTRLIVCLYNSFHSSISISLGFIGCGGLGSVGATYIPFQV